MLISKYLNILRCKTSTSGLLGKELPNARRGLTSLRVYYAVQEHLVAEDFNKHNPKACWPQGQSWIMKIQDEESRQEQYCPLVQCFAVAAKDRW